VTQRSALLVIVVLVVLVVASNALWVLSIRYAAEREKVTMPAGPTFDVLVHRDGVMLYTKTAGYANAYSILPTAVALLRHRRRGPWRWAVSVRQSPFTGYKNLLHELYDNREAARQRARGVEALLRRGERLWPTEWEL
jgi:hypothetical protein